MKKKLSLFVTIALAGFLTIGCSVQDIFKKKEQEQAEQKEEEKHQEETQEVVKVQSVVLTEDHITLDVGEKYQILANVFPENANQNLIYKTSNSHVCGVTKTGLITAYESGTASIKVSSEENAEIFKNFAVEVNEESENPPVNYTVSFNANGGSGTMDNQTTSGKTFVVPNCQFNYPNHSFLKWALNSVDGTQYSVGETIKNISSNIELYALWHDDSLPPVTDPYYSTITEDMSGETLRAALHSIIDNNSVSVSYDWSRYEAADEDPNNINNVILIYARNSVPKSAHVNGTTGWNREHTFPQSKMNSSDAKSDNHIIFASDNKVNGARGNLKMGVVNNGTTVKDYFGNNTTCQKGDSLFDPHNVARGIVARSTMYAAAMYNYDPEDNFESIETMLRWHLEYPVDSLDLSRNETVYTNQHNRNPFVDHPEYACKIWGTKNATTKSICGIN